MNLLLLLSALLSALSGLGGSVRAPVAVQAVAEASAIQPTAIAAARRAARRPLAALPSLAVTALRPLPQARPLAALVPAWKNRRRE